MITTQESDADLGYIKMYAESLHRFLDSGGQLEPDVALIVQNALKSLQTAHLNTPKSWLAKNIDEKIKNMKKWTDIKED